MLVALVAACEKGKVAEPRTAGQAPPVPTPTGPPSEVTAPEPPPPPPAEAAPPTFEEAFPQVPPAVTLTPPPGVVPVTRVALLLPLSGANAPLGNAMLNAAQMALFDVADESFVLLPRDTRGTPEGARRAVRAALDDGARLVLGPLFATSVAAIAPEARGAAIKVIAFSTDRSVAGDGVYIMGFLPREQVARVVAFARKRGLERFAALVPDTAYGNAVVEALRDALVEHGGALSRIAFFPPEAPDISGIVRRLARYEERHAALVAQREELAARDDEAARRALRRIEGKDTLGEVEFDAVMLPLGGERLREIVPLLPFYDVDPERVRFLGTGQWDDPSLGTEPALVGGWFSAPPPKARRDFVQRYTETYGRAPLRLATLAYDATALAATLLRRETGPGVTDEALTQPSGFLGVDGIFRFRPEGIAQRGLAVLEMRRNRFRVVSPAPESFGRLIY